MRGSLLAAGCWRRRLPAGSADCWLLASVPRLPAFPRLLGLGASVNTRPSLWIASGCLFQGERGCLDLDVPQSGARTVRGRQLLLLESVGGGGAEGLVLGPDHRGGAVRGGCWACSRHWLTHTCFWKENKGQSEASSYRHLGRHLSLGNPVAASLSVTTRLCSFSRPFLPLLLDYDVGLLGLSGALCETHSWHLSQNVAGLSFSLSQSTRLPKWLSGKEFACQCRRYQFDLGSGRSP